MAIRNTAYILCPNAEENPNYSPWLGKLSLPYRVVEEVDPQWSPPDDASIVVAHCQYRHPEVAAIKRCFDAEVPVLMLADGILEYRNTWENPNLPSGAIFQPVVGHKLACIGRSQARVVSSWGNAGVCEVVGLPRLDNCEPNKLPASDNGKYRILIITARSPGFDEDQLARTRRALVDLKNWIEPGQELHGRSIEFVWRINEALANELDIEMESFDHFGNRLTEVIATVDAVITTPSTSMLEAMIMHRPVALLDYHACPHYVPAAWTISCDQHIDRIVDDLLAPPEPKLEYQQAILADALECESPAAPRMVRLIEEMARLGNECRDSGSPLQLPERILETSQCVANSQVATAPSDQKAQSADLTSLNSTRIALEHAEKHILHQYDDLKDCQFRVQAVRGTANKAKQRFEVLNTTYKDLKREYRLALERERIAVNEVNRQKMLLERAEARVATKTKKIAAFKALQTKRNRALRKKQAHAHRLKAKVRSLANLRKKSLRALARNEATRLSQRDMMSKLNRELLSLHSHWFIGRTIRFFRWIGKDKSQSEQE